MQKHIFVEHNIFIRNNVSFCMFNLFYTVLCIIAMQQLCINSIIRYSWIWLINNDKTRELRYAVKWFLSLEIACDIFQYHVGAEASWFLLNANDISAVVTEALSPTIQRVNHFQLQIQKESNFNLLLWIIKLNISYNREDSIWATLKCKPTLRHNIVDKNVCKIMCWC